MTATDFVAFGQEMNQGTDSPEAQRRFWTRKRGTESADRCWATGDMLVSTVAAVLTDRAMTAMMAATDMATMRYTRMCISTRGHATIIPITTLTEVPVTRGVSNAQLWNGV